MNISNNSQLGIRYAADNSSIDVKKFLRFDKNVYIYERLPDSLYKLVGQYNNETFAKLNDDTQYIMTYKSKGLFVKNINSILDLISKETPSEMFAISDTVYDITRTINIPENFDYRIFNKFPVGYYTYLMGNNRFLRFKVVDGGICGFYLDNKFGMDCSMFFIDINKNELFCEELEKSTIIEVIQLLIFVELADIEIIEIAPGKNNGATKKNGKIANTSKFNIKFIDSKWNTISVRTEGFGVNGHLRWQACGKDMGERKLIWVDPFEKTGYVRNGNKLENNNQ